MLSTFEETLADNNFILLDLYKGYKDKVKVKCHNGHTVEITPNNFMLRVKRKSVTCKECAKISRAENLKEAIIKILKDRGSILISDSVSYSKPAEYVCSKGHNNKMAISNIMNGKSCPDCCGNKKVTCNTIKLELLKYGYIVSDTQIEGTKTKFNCTCPNGHIFVTSFDNFSNRGRRCPSCISSVSTQEKEVCSFIESIYKGKIIKNDRTILKSQELDIVLPDLNLAIEYCGLYWHSELNGKSKKYHLNKYNECKSLGYRLITIFEDEWLLKNSITKSRLISYIDNTTMLRVHARKCCIKEINSREAKEFLDKNHLQGYGSGAAIRIGAFLGEELLAVMSFSKPSFAKGNKSSKEGYYELHRFCSKIDVVVIGVASKLLKYFENNYFCIELFSFADKRWSVGNLYTKLGFDICDKDTEPNYWYFKNNIKRIHRFKLRKTRLDTPIITEWENRVKDGYNRVWDCGNIKFIKRYY